MLTNNNTLANRLNSYRAGTIIPKDRANSIFQEQQVTDIIDNSIKTQIINYTIDVMLFVTKCLAYGYSLKTVFNVDWHILSIISVGFSIEVITTKLFDVFSKHQIK